jgi:hypothetical protein
MMTLEYCFSILQGDIDKSPDFYLMNYILEMVGKCSSIVGTIILKKSKNY